MPDIAVLPWAAIPRQEDGKVAGELHCAPDWMIEILSPGQSQTKVFKKIAYALAHGTQLGWLIVPRRKNVFLPIRLICELCCMKLLMHSCPVPEFADSIFN